MAWKVHLLPTALAVFVAVAVFYSPTRRYSLVNYDDHEYVVENAHIKDGLTVSGVEWAFSSCGYASNWHPLSWISMMLDVSAARMLGDVKERTGWMKAANLEVDEKGGEWTAYDGYVGKVMHLHNLALHAANAALLLVLAWTLLRRQGGAGVPPGSRLPAELAFCALLCLLWALHPLRMEVVCWASERKELLCVFFMLISLALWFREDGGSRSAAASAFFFALALMSKPVAVTLPAVMFAFDLVFLGRVRWRRLAVPAVLSVACCAVTMSAQKTAMADTPYALRLSMALKAPLVYLRQTVWPSDLSFFYLLDDKVDWPWAVCGAALLVLLAWVCFRWLRRREKWVGVLSFGVAWCYVGLVPMLGLVKVGNQPHSDRYTYWVGCGMVACISLLLCPLLRKLDAKWRGYAVKALVTLTVAYAVVGTKRMPVWRDPYSLMTDGYQKSKAFVDVAERYSWILYRIGEQPRAEAVLRESASKWPCAASFAQLGLFLALKDSAVMQDMDEVRYFANRALEIDGRSKTAYRALVGAAMREDDLDEAVRLCEEVKSEGLDVPELEKQLPELKKKIAARPPGWKKAKRVPWE